MTKEPRMEEQMLSQAAEIGLSTQLDAVERIEVDVQTDLLKMAQGKADAVSMTGQGLVVQKDIRLQEVEVHTSRINIDWLSAIFGEVELHQPTDATVRVLLTEADINRAMNSKYIRSKMRPIELCVENQPVMIEMQQMELQLPGSGRMLFSGSMLICEPQKTRQVSFTASGRPRTDNQPVLIERFQCTDGQGIPLELAVVFMEKASELVNLPYFELEGTAFRINSMEVQKGSLALEVEAHIQQFPSL